MSSQVLRNYNGHVLSVVNLCFMLSWFCVELNEQSILQVGCGFHVHIKDRSMERWNQGKQWLIDFPGQLFIRLNTGRISIKMLLLIFYLALH